MEVSLEVTRPKGGTKTFAVSKTELVVGRGKDCDMQILSTEVSRRHCQFKISDARVTVRDLGSANGTELNGITIEANTDVSLDPGALVEVGPLKIVVRFTPSGRIVGGMTSSASKDGTMIREPQPAQTDTVDEVALVSETQVIEPAPADTAAVDEETLEEIEPVIMGTAPAEPIHDTEPEALEAHGELEADVQFDMTAVVADVGGAVEPDDELLEPEELPEAMDVGDDSPLEAEAPVAPMFAGPVDVAEPGEAVIPDASAEETVAEAEVPAEPAKKSGGLKSLFGLMGRGKKKAAEQTAATEDQPTAAPPVAPPPSDQLPTFEAPNAEPVFAEAPVAPVADVVAAPAAPAADAVGEADLGDEDIEDLLDDLDEDELEALLAGEDLDDVESDPADAPAASPAPPPPADPGLADFLNQIGQGDA